MSDNDTRGWSLVHDQIRAVLAEATTHVAALRAGDPAGAKALDAWWQSFSRSLAHHMHTEDARIWPSLEAADPEVAAELRRLTQEHHDITQQLRDVDAGFAALPGVLASERFPDARTALLGRLAALRASVDAHLLGEETTAFDAGHSHVDAAEWGRIEQDMVKGLSLRDVSTLLPRILQQASPADRELMLGRLPPLVRLIGERVFEPRYARLQRRLPR